MALLLVVGLGLLATVVNAKQQITLRSTFSDNGRLACRPKFACVSGVVTPASTIKPNALNVATIRISVAGQTATASVVPKVGGEWRACLSRTVKASASRRYDLVVTGISKDGTVLETQTVRSMSFGHGIVLDGQSNMMFPIAASTIPGDVVLTNATWLVEQWAKHNFYNIAFMVTGTGATALSGEPRVTFPVITKNWTRHDTPGFGAFLQSAAVGWLSVTSCIEHARLNGPTHCLQIAVPTTRIETHMSRTTYARSGMVTAKPFTTAGAELLQAVGGLWNTKLVMRDWQMDAWHWRQGESNSHNPSEYAVLLSRFVDDIFEQFVDTAPEPDNDFGAHDGDSQHQGLTQDVAQNQDDDDDGSDNAMLVSDSNALHFAAKGVQTVFVVYALPTYNGTRTWVIPPSVVVQQPANPPFNFTAEAQRVMDGKTNVCFVRTAHLGYFSLRDGGLHIPDTAMNAAIDAAECYQNMLLDAAKASANRGDKNLLARVPNVVVGPKPQATANVTAWNSTTGAVTVAVAFDTERDPVTGDPLDIAWTLIPRPSANAPTPFSYTQFTGTQFAQGVVQEPISITTEGQVLSVNFVVQQPSFGRPVSFTYSYMGDFARSLITNDPSAVTPHPFWQRAPIPADPFTVTLSDTTVPSL